MKMLVAVVVLTLATVHDGMGTTDLPYPWLSLDRAAKLLHLHCKSPPEASRYWEVIHDIRLSAFLNQYSVVANTSLVNMTFNMERPKVNNLFAISQATLEGTWMDKSMSVDFLFPVTSKELGRYFCTVVYSDRDDRYRMYMTGVAVDKTFISSHTDTPPESKNNFEVSIIDADEVRVTWMKPENSKLKEASVSRIPVDVGGNGIAPSESLFSTNGVRRFVYDPELVLLTKFSPEHSGNLSIILYVKRERQSLSYRYSCRVPYSACVEDENVFCMCCQNGTDPDRQICPTTPADSQSPTSEGDSSTFFVPFIIFFVLFVLCVLCLAIVIVLFKTAKCPNQPPAVQADQPLVKAGQPPVKAGQLPVKAGQPPVKAGQPPVKASQPPVKAGQPPVKAGQPPVQAGQPPVKASQPPVKAGQPPVKASQPPVKASQPPVKAGQPPVKAGQPPVKAGQPPVKASQPPVKAGQPPVKAGQPPVQAGQPPVKASQPPVKASQPPVKAGQPPVKAGQPPVQAGQPPVKASQPPVKPGQPLVQAGQLPVKGSRPMDVNIEEREEERHLLAVYTDHDLNLIQWKVNIDDQSDPTTVVSNETTV